MTSSDSGADGAAPGVDELRVVRDGSVLRLTLNRPARRNALGRSLVAALRRAFAAVEAGGETRVVVLGGEGSAFCAGADIAEFVEAAERGLSRSDAEGIVDLLGAMAACPLPIVARVHGAAFGGAVGLVCACDIAIAAEDTRFALSEARLGLVAAVIAPYVVAALGPREAKARILLGSPFSAEEALRIGLVHRVVPSDGLDPAVDETVSDLLRCAPGALAAIKRLPAMVQGDPAAARAATMDLLVERLASDEGQEGLRAFLEKRPPAWVPEWLKAR
jgi:methylglutaconyl-CoA hydratase